MQMHGLNHMDGWGWFWMTFVTVFWVVILGVVVYVAARLAQQHERSRERQS